MIVRLNGGAGNQMFQYAFGRSVSLARNEELFFEKYGLDEGYRTYFLNVLKTHVQFANGKVGPSYDEPSFNYNADVYAAPFGSHFIGYWQTERYFNVDVVRQEFSLQNPVSEQTSRMADNIRSAGPSAFIHVRRTDYLIPYHAEYHGNMTMEYYQNAMGLIRAQVPDVKFFVFSDDPKWCRQNFPDLTVVEHNNQTGQEHEDLYLMGLCQHAVIPNSSFGWWGAWLGDFPGKIVVAPKRWFAGANLNTDDIIPERWVKL